MQEKLIRLYKVNDHQWVEYSELKNFYPTLFEIAQEKDSNGQPTAKARVYTEMFNDMPSRFIRR